jgi:hypothetical protein
VIGGVFGDHSWMNTARALLLCTLLATGACHRDSDAPVPAQPAPRVAAPVAVKKGPTAQEQTAGMVEAATQGKSQLPVLLKFELPQRPTVGQPMGIDIAVLPQIDAGGADIEIAGGDGLTVSAPTPIDLHALEAGQVYRQTIQVTPTSEGVLLLGLTVSMKHDEMTESRVFSVPLIVDR